MFIILAPSIPTCSMVEPLALSKAVLSISYLIVILSGCFLFWGNFFFFCPSCIESSVSWQNFPSAQLNPLLPLSCFRKSHRAQPNDKGRKGNIYNDVRNSQSGKKRIKEDNPKELCCAEPGTRRSSINWTGLVHDRNVPSLGIQQVGLLNSSETSISHMARSSCVPSGRNCILY